MQVTIISSHRSLWPGLENSHTKSTKEAIPVAGNHTHIFLQHRFRCQRLENSHTKSTMEAISIAGNHTHVFLHHRFRWQKYLICKASAPEKVSWRGTTPRHCGSTCWRSKCEQKGPWRERFQLRASASEGDSIMLKNSVGEVEKMRASAIKNELKELGVSYADCFEKQDLVVRLASARLAEEKKIKANERKATFSKPLAQLSITRLRHTANSPKNYIVVPLKINNQGPFNFILDTGSTVTLVQPSVVIDQLKLPVIPAKKSLALLGGGVSDQRVMSVNFPNVLLGNYPMNNISALLMDQAMLQGWDPSIAGLLGINILSQFDVEFDFRKEVLVFHRPGAASRSEIDVDNMKMLETSDITLGILGLKVALGRARPELALLDLGSSLCVATPDIARLAGVPENVINSKNPALGGGGIGQLTSMQFSSGYLDTTLITAAKRKTATADGGDFTVRGAQFAIGDIPALRAVGCRILLGVNLFRNIRMIYSQSTKSVYMERPMT